MTVRTILIAIILLIALSVQATVQAPDPISCTVVQTTTNPDGTKTSSVRFAEHCVLLPVILR